MSLASSNTIILKLTKDQRFFSQTEEMGGATNEDYYIVLTALTGLAFLLAAAVIGYILYSLYKVSVEQKCLCLCGRCERGQSNFITLEIVSSHQGTTSQILQQQPPPSYQQASPDPPSYESILQQNIQEVEAQIVKVF